MNNCTNSQITSKAAVGCTGWFSASMWPRGKIHLIQHFGIWVDLKWFWFCLQHHYSSGELIYWVSSTEPNRPAARAYSLFMSHKFPPNCIYVAFLHFIARGDYLSAVWWFQVYSYLFIYFFFDRACMTITSAHSKSLLNIWPLWPVIISDWQNVKKTCQPQLP